MYVGALTAPFGQESFEQVVKWAGSVGMAALEVAAGPGSRHIDPANVTKEEADKIHALLARHNVKISSLAYYTNILDPARQQQVIDHLKLTIQAAQRLGLEVVCTMAGMPVPGKDRNRTITEDFGPVFRPIAKFAADHGIKLAFENWTATNIRGLDNWDRVFEVIPDENVGLNYDPSHLYWQGIDYLWAIERFAARIFHVHAKDTEVKWHRVRYVGNQDGGGWWRYCIPGYGGIHWGELIAHLKSNKYDGVLSIEHEDGLLGREEGFLKGMRHLQQFT